MTGHGGSTSRFCFALAYILDIYSHAPSLLFHHRVKFDCHISVMFIELWGHYVNIICFMYKELHLNLG